MEKFTICECGEKIIHFVQHDYQERLGFTDHYVLRHRETCTGYEEAIKERVKNVNFLPYRHSLFNNKSFEVDVEFTPYSEIYLKDFMQNYRDTEGTRG